MSPEEFFRDLHEKLSDRLYYYLRRFLGEDEAYDALQLTWEKFFKEYNRGNLKSGSEKSWLYRTAHNQAIDLIRKKKKLVNDDKILDFIPSKINTVYAREKELWQNELRTLFIELASDFDSSGFYLRLLSLLYEDSLSQKEIAVELEISERTVRRKIKKLFAYLEKELEKRGINLEEI